MSVDFVLALHSHLPWVLHHGRWPHGSDWLCEAAVDTYLPLVEMLGILEHQGVPSPLTLGVTPVLANQLAHPRFARELSAFFAQRLTACDEAEEAFLANGEEHLVPMAGYWRERYRRLRRLYQRWDGDLLAALRHQEGLGRIELMSSAATHGFLPLLGREESIALQLRLGRAEHVRLFGREPAGCWIPECAYRPRGRWHPDPAAAPKEDRPGIEAHLAGAGYRFFFVDSHLAEAGRPLGLYREGNQPDGLPMVAEDPLDLPAQRSPYRPYEVAPRPGRRAVTAFVRDPRSSRQVWSRHGGYPGDPAYLEFHKIRFPGGLKLWRVTHPQADLGLKQPYEPNLARARAHGHAGHWRGLLQSLDQGERATGGAVIVAPFDTELFGHWWLEGVDFIGDLYRRLAHQSDPVAVTASAHLSARPARAAIELGPGSWGAGGDFSMWLNRETRWTWERLWPLEERFWRLAPTALADPACHPVLAQAARELLLLQASDWQFIISTGAAADYAAQRFVSHATDLAVLLDGLEPASRGRLDAAARHAEEVRERDDLFPEILPVLAEVIRGAAALEAA